ncbi:MAG: serine/threonine-protein kinase [Candidatus Eisenbacteria bacterium]|nr:serine/threonine-protein kinase [Candidatus Eisenbacteria bacterium]
MALSPGTKLGPYEITAPLGAGGMGEVYRARDGRLGRDVAIKLIPDAFANDPERLARFEREAKLLASLKHANIAVLHGLEEAGGRRFLVMECVEGESLAQRLRRGTPPLGEALEIARAVAAALEAAHEGGIVHRDLKPGNVMVTPAGDVKVLDFGLAKGGAGGSSDPNMSASPTLTYAGTEAGVILGTAAYMSPEQARGKAVDRRTDIWSFGCVLFELLSGRQAFTGETVSDIVACILQVEPEWTALPAATPERLRALLRRCLEKDAKRRLRDIGEARIEIEDLIAAGRSGARTAPAAAARRPYTPGVPALAVVAALALAAGAFLPRLIVRTPPPEPARFEVAAPPGPTFYPDAQFVSLSPDGRTLAFVVPDSAGVTRLWIRRLDSITPSELPGTEGALIMFWSPDSRTLAYFASDERLMRVALEGGTPEKICDTKAARGGSWNRDGVIVLAPYPNGGIYKVSAAGGPLVQLTHPDSAHGVTGHRFPVFLPDGRHFLFSAIPAGPDGKGGVCVGSLDGGPTREIARGETGPVFVAPGWLLTTRNARIVALPFDARAARMRGEPVVIGDVTTGTQFAGGPVVSASRDGSLAYLEPAETRNRLAWLDLAGRETSAPPVPPGDYVRLAVAPDGRRALLVVQTEPTRSDLVLVDLERGARQRLTQSPENAVQMRWSPDGTQIAWLDDTRQSLHVLSLADGSRRDLLAGDHGYKRLDQWTPDGRSLLIERLDPVTRWDLWLLPVDGGPPTPCVRTPTNDQAGQVSPDGRWVAFQNDESGTVNVYIQPLAGAGARYQVTLGGGVGAWSPDGRRYLFSNADEPGVIHQAEVRAGPPFSLGPATVLSRLPANVVDLDMARDGRRWLVLLAAGNARPPAAVVLQNWQAALRRH